MTTAEIIALVHRRDELAKELADIDRALESVTQASESALAETERRRATGRIAGLITASRMTPEQRRERASKAAKARWSKEGAASER